MKIEEPTLLVSNNHDASCNGTAVKNGLSEVPSQKHILFLKPMEQSCKNIKQVLENDCTNRYQSAKLTEINSRKKNYLLESEMELSQYFGMKYALGVCSGGMAIMLGLKAIKRVMIAANIADSSVRVYSNSFTFNAVPSAIYNAGFNPVLIETTSELTIDLEDLEEQLKNDYNIGFKGKMVLVLSYMRARIPDMDEIIRLCKTYECILLEDNAHGKNCTDLRGVSCLNRKSYNNLKTYQIINYFSKKVMVVNGMAKRLDLSVLFLQSVPNQTS